MNVIRLGPEYIPDPTQNRALSGGLIYVGEPDTDPAIVGNQKQISVIQENGTTVAVEQPLSTGAGGVILYNGSPVNVIVEGAYSLKITSSTGVQLYYVPQNAITDSTDSFATIAAMLAAQTPSAVQSVYLRGYSTDGDGGQGVFVASFSDLSTEVAADTLHGVYVPFASDPTGASGAWVRQYDGAINAGWFGLYSGLGHDSYAALQSALDFAKYIQAPSQVVFVDMPSGEYTLATGVIGDSYVFLNAKGSNIIYTGSGTAVTLGTDPDGLNYGTGFVNFRMYLSNKAARGVICYATQGAKVSGYIEGYYGDFTTRTNVGVGIDGANISSFLNEINVQCNHMHIGFDIYSTGTIQPTSQFFINSSSGGDYGVGDTTSIGYRFQDSSILGLGDGTKIIGGNLEFCATGIYFGQNSRSIDVNTRFEGNGLNASCHATHAQHKVVGSGTNLAQYGAGAASGFVGFNSTDYLGPDTNGNTRSAGNDSSFAGLVPPIRAFGEKDILFKSGSDTFFHTTETATGTSAFIFQPGAGSGGYGAYLELYGQAHAINPGDVRLGPGAGSGGAVRITNGMGGADRLVVSTNSAAGETALWVYDQDNATLERVTVGAADSGGVGYKVLRIPN